MHPPPVRPLYPPAILALLDDKTEVFCLAEVDSTNNEAKRLITNGQTGRMLITAERQSAGRGRTGKSFYSLLEGSVYMTLAEPAKEAGDPAKITVAVAVAVAEAVEFCTGISLGIKWVNDLYYQGKKVCGILCENMQSDAGNHIIIGIGINIGKNGIPKELESIVTSIDLGGVPRETLIAKIVNRYGDIRQRSFEDILAGYRTRSVLTGKTITFEREGRQIKAAVQGIDDGGRLIVWTENGHALTLCSGEVSIVIKS